MKTLKYMVTVCLLIATSMLYACSQVPAPLPEAAPPETTPAEQLKSKPGDLQPAKSTQEKTLGDYNGEDNRLPVRFQNPSYLLKEQKSMEGMGQKDEKFTVQVGADVTSTTGPIPLKDILKRLAALKNMNVSWSSDVDQYVLVDVDIRAEDDFYQAIDNLLRQQDYYHMVQGNTIVVNYKETRKFHIALPFMASNYKTGIGGDVDRDVFSGDAVALEAFVAGTVLCGDGTCDPQAGENQYNCPQDCNTTPCGNGTCDPGETRNNCAVDCYCGNGTCDAGENANNCPTDC